MNSGLSLWNNSNWSTRWTLIEIANRNTNHLMESRGEIVGNYSYKRDETEANYLKPSLKVLHVGQRRSRKSLTFGTDLFLNIPPLIKTDNSLSLSKYKKKNRFPPPSLL